MWMFGSRTTVKKVRNSLTWFSHSIRVDWYSIPTEKFLDRMLQLRHSSLSDSIRGLATSRRTYQRAFHFRRKEAPRILSLTNDWLTLAQTFFRVSSFACMMAHASFNTLLGTVRLLRCCHMVMDCTSRAHHCLGVPHKAGSLSMLYNIPFVRLL